MLIFPLFSTLLLLLVVFPGLLLSAQAAQQGDLKTLYPAYVRSTWPITQKLFVLNDKIDALHRDVSLQQLAGWTTDLKLQTTNWRFDRGEQNLFSYQLIQTALDALDEAVSYWREGNDIRYLSGDTSSYLPFEVKVVQSRITLALQCIQDLKELHKLRQTFDEPEGRYLKNPDYQVLPAIQLTP